MRCLVVCAAFLALNALSAELPRNPFWPQDYEGTRYPITVEPRFKPKPKEAPKKNPSAQSAKKGGKGVAAGGAAAKKGGAAAKPKTAADLKAEAARKAAEAARKAEEKLWTDARKSLKFGPSTHFSSAKHSGAAVTINGRVYGAGDLISTNFGGERFTWTIDAISSDGKMRLRRLKHRPLEQKGKISKPLERAEKK